MAGRGPKPKSKQVLEMRGNYNHHSDKEKPATRVGCPNIPKFLDPIAKQIWRRLAPQLEKIGTIAMVDQFTFANYCQAYSRLLEIEKYLNEHGQLEEVEIPFSEGLFGGMTTETRVRPQANLAIKLRDQVQKLQKDFGLSAKDRSTIILPKDWKPTSGEKDKTKPEGKGRFFRHLETS